MPDWIGRPLSKVEIQKLLGRGGMAELYLGRHTTLDRPVAVKAFFGHFSEDPALLARFEREARAVAAMRHPNIVQVFDFAVSEGWPYIVMELLPCPSLADYLAALQRNPADAPRLLPQEITARRAAGIAAALDYAHARGIVHRVELLDSDGANLLAQFDSFEITGEPSPDHNPFPTGPVVYRDTLATQALVHIRYLLVAFPAAPLPGEARAKTAYEHRHYMADMFARPVAGSAPAAPADPPAPSGSDYP